MARIGDLELDQDLRFEQREWIIQRLGWGTMLLIIVAAVLGLFGTGPLSTATVGDSGGPLEVEYQRFVRHDGRTTMTMLVDGSVTSEGQAEVWLAASYLGGVDIQYVSPEPQEVRIEGVRHVYVFAVGDSTQQLEVRFSLKPRQIGRLRGNAGILGGPEVAFNQICYP